MKRLLSIFMLFILSFSSKAQQNLVPNPSFEDTVYCPWGTNQLDACANWLNFGNSPDYFNTCTGFGGPPLNYNFGFQYPHSGNAMAGIVSYARSTLPSGPNYREFIGAQLSSPLVIGIKYYLSFYVNATTKFGIASDKLGLKLSTIAYDSSSKPLLNNISNLYTDSILKDTVLWVRLDTSFIADSTYDYVMIGNFFDDFNTETDTQPFNYYAYYYIDDVCITMDSLYNQNWTGFSNVSQNTNILIFPNPTSGNVNIKSGDVFNEIELVNFFGQTLFLDRFQFISNYIFYLPSSIVSGVYFLKVRHKNSLSIHKLIVQF